VPECFRQAGQRAARLWVVWTFSLAWPPKSFEETLKREEEAHAQKKSQALVEVHPQGKRLPNPTASRRGVGRKKNTKGPWSVCRQPMAGMTAVARKLVRPWQRAQEVVAD
jgi:hypothetical protein